MPDVMIKCPATGKAVPTGFSLSKETFESAQMNGNSFGPCPACRGTHTWDKKDAWVQTDKK